MSNWGSWTDRVPVQNPDLAWRIVEEECILVDPQGSQATVLNPVGARIWELSDGKRTVGQILDQVLDEYAVERERLETDTKEFLGELSKRRLISFDGLSGMDGQEGSHVGV